MSEPVKGAPPKESLPPVPKPPKGHWDNHFEHIGVGSIVEWYEAGDGSAEPYPAMVMKKYPKSKSVDLLIWAPGGRTVAYGTRDGVRHHEDPSYNEFQKKECGSWKLTAEGQRIYDAIS